MKIRAQIFLIGLLVAILPLIAVSSILITFYEKELDKTAIDDLRSITAAQIAVIDNFFAERDTNLSMVSDYEMLHRLLEHNPGADSGKMEEDKEMMEEIFRAQMNKRRFVYSLTAIDKEFNIVVCTEPIKPDEDTQLKNASMIGSLGRDIWFSHILEAGEFGASNKCLVAVKAVFNESNEIIGYLVEEIALDFIENLRLTTEIMKEGSIYITDGKGGLISAGISGENRQGQEYILKDEQREGFTKAWAERDRNARVGIIRYLIGNKTYLTSYGGFESSGWNILSTVCMDDILHSRDNFIRVIGAAVLVSVLLIAAISVVMRRMLSAPIERMVNVFTEIREERDYTKRIEGIPNNEIGLVAEEVNNLLEDIEITIRRQEETLVYLKERAERDPLTDLFNKTTTKKIFLMKMDNARVERRKLACILVDIDDFKNFNTEFGHSGGDAVIWFVASVMKEMSLDNAGRIGGDEFVMCLDSYSSEESICLFLDKFVRNLREGIDILGNGIRVPIACSIGVAFFNGRTKFTYEEMIDMADRAMYYVKNSSKNGYYIIK